LGLLPAIERVRFAHVCIIRASWNFKKQLNRIAIFLKEEPPGVRVHHNIQHFITHCKPFLSQEHTTRFFSLIKY